MCARLVLIALVVVSALTAQARLGVAAEPEAKWVAATPDEMVDLSLRAALKDGPDALARTVLIATFEEDAEAGKALAALDKIGKSSTSVAGDARWLARMITPEIDAPWPGLDKVPHDDTASPLVRTFAILGPFEDTGGGLKRTEGPDRPTHRWSNADYSWGVFAVRTQRSITTSVTARGLPLDLYVHPRSESCTYLATAVTVPAAMPIVVHVASAGSLRMSWDHAGVLLDEASHRSAIVDRAAVRIEATAGDHVLGMKVCTGAQGDAGRVRVRFAKEGGADLALATSSDPAKLDAVHAALKKSAVIRYQRQATPLEKTVAAETPEQALAAAVVLRLAGTDDQRSTRAPGLLDTLAGEPDVATDQLALAGFLAPSIANQSGWLTQAIERGRAASDASTLAFAQRSLVSLRLEGDAIDLAKATADEPPLKSATDAHARWLRARLYSELGTSGLQQKAKNELQAIVKAHGSKTPLSVWRSLSRASATTRERLGALEHLAQGTTGDRGPSYVGAHAFVGATTLEQVALREVLHQPRVSNVIRLGTMLHDAGRYASAKALLTLATQLAPNRSDAFHGLARTLRAMSPAEKADAATLALYERAAELEPSDARLQAELRFRRGDASQEADPGEDAAYIVDAKVFLARAKAKPAPATGLFARQLHWRRVVRMLPDKRVSQMMHYAREIIVPPRTEGERFERMPGGYGSELLVARVHKKNGAVVAPEEQDAAGPMVRWPPLERGDVIEIAVRNWTPGPVGRRGDAPFYFADYVGSVDTNPILYNDVVIDAPVGSPLAFDVIGGKADEHKTKKVKGRTIDHLIWNDPPSIADEPFSPSVSELMPMVVGSIYPSWDAFLTWYQGAVEGFTAPDEQIKRMAEEITADKKTRAEKVDALFNFVADDIRYVNYQSGEWWLPNRPQHLLARRQGDCDDKAMLLISLLKAVGVDATEVLIQTRHTAQRRVMQSSKVAIPMFDHGIVYLPNENGEGGRFLDATSPESRIGPLPAMDSGAMAILVESGQTIQPTASAAAADHGVTSTWTMKLSADGTGTLTAKEVHVGDMAFRLRTHLKEEDTRPQWVENNLVSDAFPGVTMDPKVAFDPTLAGGAATVDYGATTSSMARREGDDLVVAVAPPRPITMILAPLVTRTLPVELPPSIAPTHRKTVVELLAPPSHVFAALPPDGVADGGSFGKASLVFELSKDKKKVTIHREVTFSQWRVSVAEYAAWRSWLQKIDGLLQRTVRLTPKK